ncbi:MAG: FAD-dependent oxidoreductase [Synergistaceae bacterium]|nr:FAD-dependent oxidoreductase [Synergistaceae bacterium]
MNSNTCLRVHSFFPRRLLRMGLLLLTGVLLLPLLVTPLFAERDTMEYDVVVAGGGAGGTSAAIAAVRLGARVALLEETDWLGGQMTAAGVSTMDDLSGNKTGIYGEFSENVRYHYFKKEKSVSTCYWDGNTTAFEPSVGRNVLLSMIEQANSKAAHEGAGRLDVFYRSQVTSVHRRGPGIHGVTAVLDGRKTDIVCSVLIDATEYGDMLPLANALYRAGNSKSPVIDSSARIQDITWVAVIKKYPGGIPQNLRITTPPPGYVKYLDGFRQIVADGGNSFRKYPLRMPVDFPTHNAYRGLPDSSNPLDYTAAGADEWAKITKTGVNWGNDFPGAEQWEGKGGLPVAYLEDPAFRRDVNAQALLKTLNFIYYVQHELREPWSVADDEFYSEIPVTKTLGIVPDEYAEIVRRFPPMPYVRESRRLVGIETPTSKTVRHNSESYRDEREGREIATSMAIGGYILDLHAGDTDADLETEFGESFASIRTDMPQGPFQVPFGSFIPTEVDGLLVTEKNLSMSRLVSGALRLQPISMLTGQAAGTIAALSVREGKAARALDPRLVQLHLLEAGSALSLCEYHDVPRNHLFWPGVQMSNLYGWFTPLDLPSSPSAKIDDIYNNRVVLARLFGLDKGVFGVDAPLTGAEAETLLHKAFGEEKDASLYALPTFGLSSFISRGDFADALARILGYRATPEEFVSRFSDISSTSRLAGPMHFLSEKGVLDRVGASGVFMPDSLLTRGAAADMTMRAVVAPRERRR